jgi:nitrous oxidase accessory protein
VVIEGNEVEGQRDGIYFEFAGQAIVRGNTVTRSRRYGLHFMRSDSCLYERNRFLANGAGVAVMYSRSVRMLDNRFERNWGSAAYGLLLKEISDGVVKGNRFVRNTVALHLDDSNRNLIIGNSFEANGWAVKLLANATDNRSKETACRHSFMSRPMPERHQCVLENWWTTTVAMISMRRIRRRTVPAGAALCWWSSRATPR